MFSIIKNLYYIIPINMSTNVSSKYIKIITNKCGVVEEAAPFLTRDLRFEL